MHKRLKGIPILNGNVMDAPVQNGIAGLDKWLRTDLALLKRSTRAASVFHFDLKKKKKNNWKSFNKVYSHPVSVRKYIFNATLFYFLPFRWFWVYSDLHEGFCTMCLQWAGRITMWYLKQHLLSLILVNWIIFTGENVLVSLSGVLQLLGLSVI